MQPESGIKTWQWVVTAIVIVVLIVAGVMAWGGKSSQAPTTSDTSATNSNSATTGSANSIIMADQYPGNVVYVSSVQLSQPGWVVIHEDNNGQPGAIIGEAYAGAGISPVKVILTSPTIDGHSYYAMLHSDNGDKKFDVSVDLPLKDQNGNIIMKLFNASASAGASVKG